MKKLKGDRCVVLMDHITEEDELSHTQTVEVNCGLNTRSFGE